MSSCSKWWPSAILDFKNSAIFLQSTGYRRPKWVILPNFVNIDGIAAELWRFDGFFLKMAAIHHPAVLKTGICNCAYGSEDQCASLCYISCWSVKPLLKYYDFSTFQNAGRLPSWICYVHVWTSNDEYLTVTITVQNLVEIDAIVSIMCKCWYLTCLAWNSYSRPKWRFLTVFCR